MRILITGGTGLIGRRLCRALLAEGHELTVFSRNPASVAVKCGAGVHALASFAEWLPNGHGNNDASADITRHARFPHPIPPPEGEGSIALSPSGGKMDRGLGTNESPRELHDTPCFDAVINLAGEPIVAARWSEQRKQALWASRVTLTEELVRHIAAAGHKPAVLLSGSAVGYYGNRGDLMLDEAAMAGVDFAARLCKAWEDAARVAESIGVRVCLLRTGLILSRDGGMLERMLLPFKLGLGARLGDGRQWMSWIHIDDYVAMVLRLLRDPHTTGPYNMTAPQPVTNAEFTAQLAAALHRPALFIAPAVLLKLSMGERASLLLEGQRVLPKKMEAAQQYFAFPDLADALRDLVG